LQLGLTDEQRALIGLSLALARTSEEKDYGSIAPKIERWLSTVDQMGPTFEGARAMLHLVRIAVKLGDLDQAAAWIQQTEQMAERSHDVDVLFMCDLNRLALDFERTGAALIVEQVSDLRARARGELQAYNTDVARLDMLAKLGSGNELAGVLDQCRQQESVFGVGSPLASRIAHRAMVA
jgi:ATP/maltotriose-dependent transcriptional regulator MalT